MSKKVSCCDPYRYHQTHHFYSDLREITAEFVVKAKKLLNIDIDRSGKICGECYKHINNGHTTLNRKRKYEKVGETGNFRIILYSIKFSCINRFLFK